MKTYESAEKSAKWTSLLLRFLAVVFAFSFVDILYSLIINSPLGSLLPEIPFFAQSQSAAEVAHAIFLLFFIILPQLLIPFHLPAVLGALATFWKWNTTVSANVGALGAAAESLPNTGIKRLHDFSLSKVWQLQRANRDLWREIPDSEPDHSVEPEPKQLRYLGRLWLLAIPALLGVLYSWSDFILFWFGGIASPSLGGGFTYLVDLQFNGIALNVAQLALTISSLALVVACTSTASLLKAITVNQDNRHAYLSGSIQ